MKQPQTPSPGPPGSPPHPPVICWGELLWDLFPDEARLGGAPANVAWHLAALGAPVAMITRVGDDERGREAIGRMRARGIASELVQIDEGRPTGYVSVTVSDAGEPSYTLADGCAWQAIAVTAEARAALAGAAAFCFGTLAQLTAPAMRAFEDALAALPSSCLRVCDPNLRPRFVDREVLRACLEAADVVKLNEGEARLVEEAYGVTDAARWLIDDLGTELVALTHGAAGSRLISRDAEAAHPGFPAAPGGDNVGAGDAYTALLIVGTLARRDLPGLVEAANRYASFVASRRGATPDPPAALLAALR